MAFYIIVDNERKEDSSAIAGSLVLFFILHLGEQTFSNLPNVTECLDLCVPGPLLKLEIQTLKVNILRDLMLCVWRLLVCDKIHGNRLIRKLVQAIRPVF